jgi:hypothetical protein
MIKQIAIGIIVGVVILIVAVSIMYIDVSFSLKDYVIVTDTNCYYLSRFIKDTEHKDSIITYENLDGYTLRFEWTNIKAELIISEDESPVTKCSLYGIDYNNCKRH